jgi:N-acetylmuramoyl-L-alanine amidase
MNNLSIQGFSQTFELTVMRPEPLRFNKIMDAFRWLILLPLVLPTLVQAKSIKEFEYFPPKVITVVIDAGHGGHDPGCSGTDAREKHITLAVAKQLAAMIRERHPSVKVILTRDKDVFVPLYERAKMANVNKADLFISIHCNFMPRNSGVHGSETFVMGLHTASENLAVAKRENEAILLEDNYEQNYDFDPNSPEGHILMSMYQNVFLDHSILFADMIESQLKSSGRHSRGVKQAGFVVLKATAMPSVLVELGFLSHREEEKFLNSEAGQRVVSTAILDAFTGYQRKVYGELAEAETSVSPAVEPIRVNQAPVSQQESGKVRVSSVEETRPKLTPEPEKPRAVLTGQTTTPGKPSPTSVNTSLPVFCIQLTTSATPLNPAKTKWASLGYPVDEIEEENRFKYQIRNFTSYEQAHEVRQKVITMGYPDAFIVPYRHGKKITMEEAFRR